jgi:hypothetical protein
LFQLLIAAPRHDDRSALRQIIEWFWISRAHFLGYRNFHFAFLYLHAPEIAGNLLRYRYHTWLVRARKHKKRDLRELVMPGKVPQAGRNHPALAMLPDESWVHIWCGDIELHIT